MIYDMVWFHVQEMKKSILLTFKLTCSSDLTDIHLCSYGLQLKTDCLLKRVKLSLGYRYCPLANISTCM